MPVTTARIDPLARVRRLSSLMQVLIILGVAFALGGSLWVWLTPGVAQTVLPAQLGLERSSIALDLGTRLAGLSITFIPVGILICGLNQAYQLFAGYRHGDVFTALAAERLRRIAMSLIALAAIGPLVRTVLILLLTLQNPPGQRLLSVALSSNEYFLFALGVMLLAIAQIMAEAVRIAEEHREIV